MKDSVEKITFIAGAVANGYLSADRKLSLLIPLIKDQDLYQSWNGTAGAAAVESMRMILYTSIISDMRSLLFDKDKRSVSVQQIIYSLENEHVAKALCENLAQPSPVDMLGDLDEQTNQTIEKLIQEEQVRELEALFHEKHPKIVSRFNELVSSDLCIRLGNARSKMISHQEINNSGEERALYNPADFDLKWSDAENIIKESESLVFDCSLIVNGAHFDLEGFRSGNRRAGNSFWERSKNA